MAGLLPDPSRGPPAGRPRSARRRRSTSPRFSLPTRLLVSGLVLWGVWWIVPRTTAVMSEGGRDGAWAWPLLCLALLGAGTVLWSFWRPGDG